MRKLNPNPYDYDSADDYYDDLDNYVNQGKCEPDYDGFDDEPVTMMITLTMTKQQTITLIR